MFHSFVTCVILKNKLQLETDSPLTHIRKMPQGKTVAKKHLHIYKW